MVWHLVKCFCKTLVKWYLLGSLFLILVQCRRRLRLVVVSQDRLLWKPCFALEIRVWSIMLMCTIFSEELHVLDVRDNGLH